VNPNPYGVALSNGVPYVIGKKRAQSVPTAIAAAPDGSLYVGELGGEETP
jgi:hypothetical protein